MHQRRREAWTVQRTRLVVGSATACVLALGMAVTAAVDLTEILCSIYTDSDPMWHLLACWRFVK